MSLNQTTRSLRSAMGLVALILFATSSFAATVTKLNEDALAPLREATVMRKIRIDKLPLFDSKRSVIDLEEFQVWEPGAKVIIHGDNGVVLDRQDPPPMRFFRGLVNGDPDSFAYFSIDGRTGSIQGLIVVHDRKFSLDSVRRGSAAPRPRNPAIDPAIDPTIDETATDRWDEYLAAFDHDDEMPTTGQSWQCEVDKMRITPEQVPKMLRETTADGTPIQAQSISGTQQYGISVVVETDYELFVSAGSNSTTLTNYIANLSGAVSTIYNRDIHTNLTQQDFHIYTSSSDPWSAATASAGLTEIGDYYHANYPSLKRSAVVMLSGKSTNSGIAWEGIVCNPDFANGADWGGAYAWCGSISNGTIPDPNATVATHLYGMPSSNYWPLAEYAHELGHILGGHHTHCVALTLAEQTATGRSYVDTCYNAEGAGCFSGTPAGGSCNLNGFCSPAPSELGTLMSYCHNVFVAGVPQSRYTFGQASEVSHHQQDDYLLNAAGPGSIGYLSNIVTRTASLIMSAISAPASVAPSSTGNAASISAIAGATYAWTASGGTITSATTGNSITFSAGASGTVSLRATAYGTNGCGVTDTKSVTITAATYNPPTNVEAHATSTTNALVSWVAPVAGTTPGRYNVYRKGIGDTSYSFVNYSVSTSYTDSVSTNKAYLYKVRSADLANTTESADSNVDLATIVIYTNLPVTAVVSTIKAVDLNELRTAVDAVRSLDSIGAGSYTYGSGSPVRVAAGTVVHAADINELRTNLNTAINGLFGTTPTYTYTITAPSSTVKAIDFNEIRNVMQ
jgi:hypothetical protein